MTLSYLVSKNYCFISNSRSETLKIPSSVSLKTKLKFVEIVMISASDLALTLAILGVIIF